MPGTTDTVKAMLTPGEFVIRKEAVDMIGVPILEKLNDMPEAGGHSEIDRLIAQATLKNMTGMYGGGMVNAKQYMGGGKVDMYGHGGMVNKYQEGGVISKLINSIVNKNKITQDQIRSMIPKSNNEELYYDEAFNPQEDRMPPKEDLPDGFIGALKPVINYEPSPMIEMMTPEEILRIMGKQKGGSVGLKPIPKDNPGLAKLPEAVRNKMGYMQEGGEVENSLMGMMYGGMAKKKNKYGYQEGGAVQDDAMMLQYLQSLQAGAEAGALGNVGNAFVPFDQRPPSSGEVMSPIPSGMEQGDMMRIIRDEREVLDMEDANLLRKKAQNALIRFKLDSIINAEGLQPERLDSLPADTSGFIPSSPMFSPRGMGL